MTEHFDVVIVGAGISGISTAWHLQDRCPTKSYVILERRENIGGTWDLFKYPGIRSDSDMFTLGFRFKPWESAKSIADGKSIWNYINEAADEYGIRKHIRTGHRVLSVDWSDADNRWTVNIETGGEAKQITASFLSVCSGYYNYDEGYSPEFPGADDFKGQIIHPQHWPEDLDYTGKNVVVIGSGATAVTLIPSLVNGGVGHVTMLQRSPTYIGSLPLEDPIALRTNKYLPKNLAHFVNRWKQIGYSTGQYQVARNFPSVFKKVLRRMAERRLPEGFDYDKHFSPRYNPWDERVCLAPNGDLFKAIRSGKAGVVTDTIEAFTETGIKLTSGEELQADIIVTATGLNMQLFGGATANRNGEPIDLTKCMTYKGLMLSGVPNMAITFGYTNASWTLKADLVSEFICRMLNYMDANGFDRVEPQHPGAAVDEMPFMDFTPGYFRRAMDSLPKSGSEAPWKLKQNYFFDMRTIRYGKVDEESLMFTKHRAAVTV
ncbi:monooxygenase, flavin-binding family [Mycolicibacterium fortuitum]|uniref:FAD-containing monooxygenase EthA n=1 Tax=Mycolicibacterium fortuitum TaxID=1766 RepID=A0A0N9YIA6_MYCFO|nr:NAD(P)/FAD-dependent oxidoreductase [Mycolicibacterium fortuitum]ALI29622.1 monooxygenase, flavin-binding family [Mycolicibacterium fortuitum]OBI55254.1 FAD-containing monooxygenase EthA [Mycolicibacterium fortuitum]UHJ57795.1 NAD(P)/FAD-dependent oxidoreductase [Mycolicibacterium fortuitum]